MKMITAAKIMEMEFAYEQAQKFANIDSERLQQYLDGKYDLEEGEVIGDAELFEALKMLVETYR
jgi:hypothetical protein